MAAILTSVRQLIHGTSAGLVDNKIPTKLSTAITDLVTSSFGIANDVLTIVRDVTAPEATQPQPQPQSPPSP